MKLEPIITEKSLKLAEDGKYTFRVSKGFTKLKIKNLVEKVFKVRVSSVRTIKEHREVKMTLMRRKKVIKPSKKAVVTLKEKDKIDLFEKAKK